MEISSILIFRKLKINFDRVLKKKYTTTSLEKYSHHHHHHLRGGENDDLDVDVCIESPFRVQFQKKKNTTTSLAKIVIIKSSKKSHLRGKRRRRSRRRCSYCKHFSCPISKTLHCWPPHYHRNTKVLTVFQCIHPKACPESV